MLGTNGYGQLGDGTTQTASRPQAVTQLEQVAQISAGEGFTCAVNTAGEAYCWGYNRNGQLGIASNVDQLEPQRLDLPPMQMIRAAMPTLVAWIEAAACIAGAMARRGR